jgi:hypothetical protein
MATSNEDVVRGTGNRMTNKERTLPEPISEDEIDNPAFNTRPADPYVIREPARHRDPPVLLKGRLRSEPMLDLVPTCINQRI